MKDEEEKILNINCENVSNNEKCVNINVKKCKDKTKVYNFYYENNKSFFSKKGKLLEGIIKEFKPLKEYVCIDIEATGIDASTNRIIELACVKVSDGQIIDTYQTLVNPNIVIEERIEKLTGISNESVKNAPKFEDVYEDFFKFIDGYVWLGHSIISDYKYLFFEIKFNNFKKNLLERCDIMTLDTFKISKKLLLEVENKSLINLCDYFDINIHGAHRALNDAIATVKVYEKLVNDYFDTKKELFIPKIIKYTEKENKQRPVTKKQITHFNKLRLCHNSDFEDVIGSVDFSQLSHSEASRYIDKIILKYGMGNSKKF